MNDDACGTYAGYQRHTRARQAPCEPCRKARNAYIREWRKRNKDGLAAVQKSRNAARSRAAWRLVREHYDEFQRYYEEELRNDELW